MSTLMSEDPNTGEEKALNESIHRPKRPAQKCGLEEWNIRGRDRKTCYADDVAKDVAHAQKRGGLETMWWYCISEILDAWWFLRVLGVGILAFGM